MIRHIRLTILWLFRLVNPGDITIRHHWTGSPFRLHSFRHKGYWWHGRNRERETMETFSKLIGRDDTVWEVGAHIGYLTGFFASIADRVTAFEPGADNLKYLKKNAPPNARIVPFAVSAEDAVDVPLYTESLTGQNNSLLADYEIFEENAANAAYPIRKVVERVSTVSLDSYAVSSGEMPDFVKIDVEGWELEVLLGMTRVLADKGPTMMIEITSREEQVAALLAGAGYKLRTRFGLNTFWEKVQPAQAPDSVVPGLISMKPKTP